MPNVHLKFKYYVYKLFIWNVNVAGYQSINKEIAQKYDITICYDKTVRYWYGYNLKNKYPNSL